MFAAGAASGQPAAAPPAFEVASIKSTPPLDIDKIEQNGLYIGVIVDKARVEIRNTSLAELIRIAYRAKRYQISGPAWMSSERFDVVAKLPDDGSAAQVPEMLQALLADRFQLVLHRDKREGNVYALVVGKNGPKLTESSPDEAASDANSEGPPAAVRTETGIDSKGALVSTGPAGSMKLTSGPNGMRRLEIARVTMASFAETLSRTVDRPVVDMTGLTAHYDVVLAIPREALVAMALSAGIAMEPREPENTGKASDPSSPTVFTAVQALGLRLDSRKAPVEFLVIDKVSRQPTEN